MAYTVLARKYRPQSFADLVGQEHVTRTLGNAIEAGRVAHAFLFTGVRGVGKTTMARLLAKALDCEKGPTPVPCGVCEQCVAITAGRSADVQEMDGASNNSVDDVRRLQESLPYRPQSSRFKIVIVDEVHMLSTGAFNAFLKTLEEPPDHVKFIFATTEVHKVPITIRSRCQRYDFRLIPQQAVSARVREILATEGVTADDEAVTMVAREAAGSMRDALTLLDQIVAFGGASLVGKEVAQVLGIADREVVHSIAEAVLAGNGAAVLMLVDQLAGRGLDTLHFAKQLLELIRDMVVLRVSGADTELVAMVPEERARAARAAETVDVQELHRAFSALSRVVEDVAQSGSPRTTLEMGLVRLATRPPLLPLAELIARFDAIERRGGTGGGSAPRPGGPGGPAPSAGPRPSRASAAPETTPMAAPASIAPASVAPAPVAPAPVAPAPVALPTPEALAPKAPAPVAQPAPPTPPARGGSVEPAEPVERAPEPRPLPSRPWPALVSAIMDTKPALGAVLQHGHPVNVTADEIVIGFEPGSFFRRQAEAPDALAVIADAGARVLGARPVVRIVEHDATRGTQTMVERASADLEARRRSTEERAREHPIVQQAAAVFSLSREAMTVHVELE